MPYGRPLDTSPDNWYKAAKTIDQNQQANEAFQSASRPAPRPISRPASATLVRINPAPVTIDTRLKREPPTCYRCRRTGHRAPDCPDKYNIRTLSLEELEMEIMARKDMEKIVESTPELEKDFVQDSK